MPVSRQISGKTVASDSAVLTLIMSSWIVIPIATPSSLSKGKAVIVVLALELEALKRRRKLEGEEGRKSRKERKARGRKERRRRL